MGCLPPFSTGAGFRWPIHSSFHNRVNHLTKSHQVTLVVAGPGGFQGLAKRQLFETFQGTWENSPMGISWPRSGPSSPGVPPLQCEVPKIANLVQISPISLWFMVFITFYDYSYWGL